MAYIKNELVYQLCFKLVIVAETDGGFLLWTCPQTLGWNYYDWYINNAKILLEDMDTS